MENNILYEYHMFMGQVDTREYLLVVRSKGKKSYGYLKRRDNSPKKIANPDSNNMGAKFVGYITKKKFEEILFLDYL